MPSREHESATSRREVFEREVFERRGTLTVFRDDAWPPGSGEPVRGVRVLPRGPLFYLDDYRYEGVPKRWVVIGSAPYSDIVLRDPAVSASQCLLLRDRSRLIVRDCNSRNGSAINGVRADQAELPVGGLLSLGYSTLVAFGDRGADQEIWIGASSLQEFIENADRLYGSTRRAALALGVPESTLRGWLRTHKFHKSSHGS